MDSIKKEATGKMNVQPTGKKPFVKPEIQVIRFSDEDIILTSGGLRDGGLYGEIGYDENGEYFGG